VKNYITEECTTPSAEDNNKDNNDSNKMDISNLLIPDACVSADPVELANSEVTDEEEEAEFGAFLLDAVDWL
jgi:hypothetical protein